MEFDGTIVSFETFFIYSHMKLGELWLGAELTHCYLQRKL